MKAPQPCLVSQSEDSFHCTKDKQISKPKEDCTTKLLKWIGEVTVKRRNFRRRTRCSNLFAEALLSNTLRKAQAELALKQEEKRMRLQTFYNSGKTSQVCETKAWSKPLEKGNEQNNHSNLHEEVQSHLASLDNFFDKLGSLKQ